jgi:hypothetical protein
MMQGDDIQKQRQQAEENYERNPTFERHGALAFWVIAEQLYELRTIAGLFEEALQKGFGERSGYIRIRQEEK